MSPDLRFGPGPSDRRLMPEGRLAGPMPWVIAIMMALTVLATAAGLAIGNAARGLGDDLAGRLTIQIAEPNAALRTAETSAVLGALSRLTAVESVRAVPEAELKALVLPWLGTEGLDDDLPVPALIEVSLKRKRAEDIATVRSAARGAAPDARVDADASWLAPLAGLLGALKWLAAALVLLMAAATAASVVLAARAALNTHRATIEVLHLLGSTDVQVARLFQRRIALDALFGGIIGLIIALAVIALIGRRMEAIGSELLGSAGIGWQGWLMIASLPLCGVVLAMLAARFTVLSALRRML
jgi:cell division transport system permease protein